MQIYSTTINSIHTPTALRPPVSHEYRRLNERQRVLRGVAHPRGRARLCSVIRYARIVNGPRRVHGVEHPLIVSAVVVLAVEAGVVEEEAGA